MNSLYKENIIYTFINDYCINDRFFLMYFVEELIHTRLRKKQSHTSAKLNLDVNRSTNELVENGHEHSSIPSGRSNA